jgi:hypothetical protein
VGADRGSEEQRMADIEKEDAMGGYQQNVF